MPKCCCGAGGERKVKVGSARARRVPPPLPGWSPKKFDLLGNLRAVFDRYAPAFQSQFHAPLDRYWDESMGLDGVKMESELLRVARRHALGQHSRPDFPWHSPPLWTNGV